MKHFIPNQQKTTFGFNQNIWDVNFPNIFSDKNEFDFFKGIEDNSSCNLFKEFNKTIYRPYVICVDQLPKEIKFEIKKLMRNKPPKIKQCLLYSQFISNQIEGVNQVLGFMELRKVTEGFKKGYPPFIYNNFKRNEIVNIWGNEFIIDDKGSCWGIHSWNQYKEYHFDILKENIYDKDDKSFLKYREIIEKKSQFKNKDNRIKIYNKYEIMCKRFTQIFE